MSSILSLRSLVSFPRIALAIFKAKVIYVEERCAYESSSTRVNEVLISDPSGVSKGLISYVIYTDRVTKHEVSQNREDIV
jgi:hypothetical protein